MGALGNGNSLEQDSCDGHFLTGVFESMAQTLGPGHINIAKQVGRNRLFAHDMNQIKDAIARTRQL